MTRTISFAVLTAALVGAGSIFTVPTAAEAGPISRACLRSDRSAANSHVCGCIQQVADATLTRSDQRQAARLIKDPDRAEKVRMSDSDKAFWKRYRVFGDSAAAHCS